MPVAIGVDIGGGSTKIGLVDAGGNLRDQATVSNRAGVDVDALTNLYVETIDGMLNRSGVDRPSGIGIGFPGRIRDNGEVGDHGNVGALNGYRLPQHFSERFASPSRMENDAAVAALAEARYGSVDRRERLLLVTVGTGIGVGFVAADDNDSVTNSFLWDAGHIIVDVDRQHHCRLGCRGCLESVASATALDSQVATLARAAPDTALGRHLEAHGAIESADVVRYAIDGDRQASQLLKTIGRWIGMAVASWCHMLSANEVRIGGGLSAAGSLLVDEIERQARRYAPVALLSDVRFSGASLGNRAGMIGAAGLFLSNSDSGEVG